MQDALDRLWPFAGEMFSADDIDEEMDHAGVAPTPKSLRGVWDSTVLTTLSEACLRVPDDDFAHLGGKNGKRHTEHLGHMLATMQVLQRSHPGATW